MATDGLNAEYVKKHNWDMNVDYDRMTTRLLSHIKNAKDTPRGKRNKAYDVTLLCQLVMASRIGEAIQFVIQGNAESNIKVEKKRKLETRLMKLPKDIGWNDFKDASMTLNALLKSYSKKSSPLRHLVAVISTSCKDRHRCNTHSLRYAGVTYMNEVEKIPYPIIAKITHHSDINMMVKYIQQAKADDYLRSR